MSGIMDCMFVWGQQLDYQWYCETVSLFAALIVDGIEFKKRDLVREVIGLKVREIGYTYFAFGSIKMDTLWYNWHCHFKETYSEPIDDFQSVVKGAIEYCDWSVAQINYRAGPIVIN